MNFFIKNKLLISSLLLVLFAFSGCSSMDRGECLTVNWYEKGMADGQEGYPSNNISDYAEDCSEYNIRPDLTAYKKGWQEGIQYFCTKTSGFTYGVNGNHYQNSCPKSLEDQFYLGYLLGESIYDKQSKLERLRWELEKLRDDHDKDSKKVPNYKKEKKRLKLEIFYAESDLSREKDRAHKMGFSLY